MRGTESRSEIESFYDMFHPIHMEKVRRCDNVEGNAKEVNI